MQEWFEFTGRRSVLSTVFAGARGCAGLGGGARIEDLAAMAGRGAQRESTARRCNKKRATDWIDYAAGSL